MKSNNIIKGLGVLLIGGAMVSCSSDYLDLEPIAQVANGDIIRDGEIVNETALRLALYGICKAQYTQYSSLDPYAWFDGEPAMAIEYGEVWGLDCQSGFWQYYFQYLPNWEYMDDATFYPSMIGWMYCYGQINQANFIISADSDNLEGEMAFRMAQAYTMRANAYTKLLQIYGPRWSDSNNGEVLSVVKRVKPTSQNPDDINSPLVKTSEILDLIYSDLNRSFVLYDKSGWGRDYIWEPDVEIAHGIYARAALLKDDWQTAYDHAKEARVYYPIMSADEYKSGFAEANSEWLWGTDDSASSLYYWSFAGTYGVNGVYPANWGVIGSNYVNYELYKQMYNAYPTDVRAELFFTPDKVSERQDRSYFWQSGSCNQQSMNINGKYGVNPYTGEKSYALAPYFAEFNEKMYEEIGKPQGWPYPFSTDFFNMGTDITGIQAQFGVAYKFWGTDFYGTSSFPLMRGAEMAFIEAEAACHLNKDAEAQAILAEINSKRISNYTQPTATGADLLALVKLNRRWELWGEGFNFFDFKRWNEPIVRNPWVEGNGQSNNIPKYWANELAVDDYNGWRVAIPQSEYQYNEDVNISDGI